MPGRSRYSFHPTTPERWGDLEQLFGPRGACAGCWCMYWRLPRSQWTRQKGAGNKRALRQLVATDPAPGILAYAGDEPIGWCAIAPRPAYPSLERSRILRPVDGKPVWSVSCFYIARDHRRKGLTSQLLNAAVRFAADRGATIVEGYPIEPKTDQMPSPWAWTGLASAFTKAGFKEVARRSETRPIMRRLVRKRGG